MKAFLQTAFIVFVLMFLPLSLVMAQDDDDTTTDDNMTDEPSFEDMDDDPVEEESGPDTWVGDLGTLLIGLSSDHKVSMILAPDMTVQVQVYMYQQVLTDAKKKTMELNGGDDPEALDFDIFLEMILETYGYFAEVRNDVYIIRPIADRQKKEDEKVFETKSFDIPVYFRFSEIIEQFKSFITAEDKLISNLNSRVIFIMSTTAAIAKIEEYFKIIDEKADKTIDYSVEELSGAKIKTKVTKSEEEEETIVIKRQIYRFPNSMEEAIVDLRNLLPIVIDAEYEPWTIINEDEKLILITGTDSDLKMVEEYIRQIKLTKGVTDEDDVPLGERIDTRVYTLSRPVADVAKDLKSFLTTVGVIVSNPEKNFIIIKDKVTNFLLLERFIQELDAEPQQVYIEATFMELKLDHDFRFGIDSEWSQGIGSLDWSFATPDVTTGYSLGVLQGDKLSLNMNVLTTNTDSNILSRPRVLIKNGKQAKIVVGQEVPYLTTDEGEGGTQQTIEFKDVSITMIVTPHVEPGDRVRMEISISIKEQIGTISLSGNETPIISNRELNTEVFVESGNTLIMGGLYENKVTESMTSLPIIGELPIIGNLFSTQYDTNRKTDLLFFITPTIVKPKDDVDIIRKGRVLKFRKNVKPVEPSWLTDPAAKRLAK